LSRKVSLSPDARSDLSRLVAFMSERDVRTGDRVRAALSSLEQMPERGSPSPTDNSMRELRVRFGRYGYVVQYWVNGDEVLVAGLYHALENR
jgi:plasmid stabilization system protein ParE